MCGPASVGLARTTVSVGWAGNARWTYSTSGSGTYPSAVSAEVTLSACGLIGLSRCGLRSSWSPARNSVMSALARLPWYRNAVDEELSRCGAVGGDLRNAENFDRVPRAMTARPGQDLPRGGVLTEGERCEVVRTFGPPRTQYPLGEEREQERASITSGGVTEPEQRDEPGRIQRRPQVREFEPCCGGVEKSDSAITPSFGIALSDDQAIGQITTGTGAGSAMQHASRHCIASSFSFSAGANHHLGSSSPRCKAKRRIGHWSGTSTCAGTECEDSSTTHQPLCSQRGIVPSDEGGRRVPLDKSPLGSRVG